MPPPHEVLEQQRHVFAALAQRRQPHLCNVQPIQQIRAKTAFGGQRREIGLRCRDHAAIDGNRFVRAEPFQRAFQDMLTRHNGNVAEASDALGMSKKTLYHKLRQLKSMTVR